MITKKFNKKTINLILIYSVGLAFTTHVNAQGITQLLADKFEAINSFTTASNSSASSSFSAQGRNYHVGGSASLRIPNPVVQPVAITLPSFKAGCEGVDMHLGSIDFASFDEYKKIWQALPKQAAAYAMQLGLSQISAIMGDTFKTVQDVVNKINSGTLDACALMKSATDGFKNDAMKIKSVANSFVKNYSDIKTSMETAGDKFAKLPGTAKSELQAIFSGNGNSTLGPNDPKTESKEADGDKVATPAAPELVLEGNILWKAMQKSGYTYSDNEKSMIMSLVGTQIIITDPTPRIDPIVASITSFNSFVEGDIAGSSAGVGKLNLLECGGISDPDCLTVQPAITPGDFTFLKLTEAKLHDIKANIMRRDKITDENKLLIQQIRVPIYRMLALALAANKGAGAANSDGLANIIIDKYKKIIAIEYAQVWLFSALKGLSASLEINGPQYETHAKAYDTIKKQISERLKEAHEAQVRESANLANADSVTRELESLSKSLATNMPANLKKFMSVR